MAFYPFDETDSPGGPGLRSALTGFRLGRYGLVYELSKMRQMTNQQVADHYGFADATVAGNAKAEIESAVAKLTEDPPDTTAAQVNAAVSQMLAQLG